VTTLSDDTTHSGTSLCDAIAAAGADDNIQFQAGLREPLDTSSTPRYYQSSNYSRGADMRCWVYSLVTIAWVVWAVSAIAQDVSSGPERGKKLPTLKVFDVTGPNKDKDLDYAAERKNLPTVYVFVQADKWDRPMARFLRKLDETVAKEGKDASVVAVWLTDNPDKTKEYLPRAQESLQFQVTALACYTGEKAGLDGWSINADAHLTVVVANQQKVAAVFGYRSVNETNVPAVHKALQKITDNN
jgi:hypothetical protein